jgi:hypothetical protein
MRIRLVAVAAWVLALTAFGCGDTGGTNTRGGLSANSYVCIFPATEGVCFEWTATQSLTPDEVGQLQAGCRLHHVGSFVAGGSCPLAGNIGMCTLTTSQVSGTILRYKFYNPPWNPVTAQSACSALGTWN